MNTKLAALLASSSLIILAACGGGDSDSSDSKAEPMAEKAEEAATEVAETADEAATAVEETANEAGDSVADMADDAKDQASGMADAAEEKASEMADAAEEKASGMVDAAGGMMDAAKDKANEAASAAGDAVDNAKAEAEGAVAAVTDAVDGAGTVHEILMLNADPDNPRNRMVFKPDLVLAKPGDTIRFVPTDPSHQSSSVDGMLPEGVEGWQGKINQGLDYVVTEPGVYGYKCVPHVAAGMVGLVVVEGEGMTDNVAAAKGVRQVGLAARRFDDIWKRADAQYLN